MRWETRPERAGRPEDLLKRFSARIQQLTERARAAVRAAVPAATEHLRLPSGVFGYRVKHQFAFVQPQQDHVRVGFAYGVLLDDPAGLLRGDGQSERYLRLERPADARRAEVADLFRCAAGRVPPRRLPRGRVQLARKQRRPRSPSGAK